jgi:hypothetical protein
MIDKIKQNQDKKMFTILRDKFTKKFYIVLFVHNNRILISTEMNGITEWQTANFLWYDDLELAHVEYYNSLERQFLF